MSDRYPWKNHDRTNQPRARNRRLNSCCAARFLVLSYCIMVALCCCGVGYGAIEAGNSTGGGAGVERVLLLHRYARKGGWDGI